MIGSSRLGSLVLLAGLLAACGPAVSSTNPFATPTAAPSRSAVTVPEALQGTWTAEVRNTTASSGRWTLKVSPNDLQLQNPGSSESFSIDPTAVTATTLTVAASTDCPDQSTVTPGTYTLKVEGNTLTISLGSDSCGDRAAVLTAGPWTRAP